MEAKAWWNTLGRVMKMSDGPLSGSAPTEKAAGKIIRPASTATTVSITPIFTAVPAKLVSRPK